MEIDEGHVERNFAETAFWWLHWRGYGSEAKALKAVRRRKGMGHLNEETATRRFAVAVAILRRTEELARSQLERAGHTRHYELSEEEYDRGTSRIEAALREEFPDSGSTVDYMIAMLWNMPYVR